MFNLTNNITLPKIGDVINSSSLSGGGAPNILQIFTYLWVFYMGGWFFAAVFGIIGAALYIKYDNAVVPVVFFIIMMMLFGGVFTAIPGAGLVSASGFMFIIGIIIAFTLGFLLYQFFISKED